MSSGICRKWRNGEGLPTQATIAIVDEITDGKSNLAYWRNLPLWQLLTEPFEGTGIALQVLPFLSYEVQRFVLVRGSVKGYPVLGEVGDRQVRGLGEIRSLDAFTALLALARISDASNQDLRHSVFVSQAFAIFAHVLARNDQMQCCFDDLFDALTFSFWSNWYLGWFRRDFSKETVVDHLVRLRTNPKAPCDVDVGSIDDAATEGDLYATTFNHMWGMMGGSAASAVRCVYSGLPDVKSEEIMSNLDDRFGMPESAFEAAIESHGHNSPVYRTGMYVPTRREVMEMEPTKLYEILIDWLWECPSELIPNDTQICEVRAILLARPDFADETIRKLVGECSDFLST